MPAATWRTEAGRGGVRAVRPALAVIINPGARNPDLTAPSAVPLVFALTNTPRCSLGSHRKNVSKFSVSPSQEIAGPIDSLPLSPIHHLNPDRNEVMSIGRRVCG